MSSTSDEIDSACALLREGLATWSPADAGYLGGSTGLPVASLTIHATLTREALAIQAKRVSMLLAAEARLLAYTDSVLRGMLEVPRMYGSMESVEAQYLGLLDVRYVMQHSEPVPRAVIDAYAKFAARRFPEIGCIVLHGYLQGLGREGELPALLAEFRAEFERE